MYTFKYQIWRPSPSVSTYPVSLLFLSCTIGLGSLSRLVLDLGHLRLLTVNSGGRAMIYAKAFVLTVSLGCWLGVCGDSAEESLM